MKRLFVILVVAICSMALVLIGGLATADRTKYNNDFVRIFPPHAADFKDIHPATDSIRTLFDGPADPQGYVAVEHISNNSAVLQTMNFAARENALTKSNGPQKYVLKRQIDGLLCTDGVLDYSSDLAVVVYTYRYRNQYVCLDTNLNVVRFGKTIDTTSVAKISVSETKGKITMAKPPLMVNRGTFVYGKYLFVHSNLMARNESIDIFKNNSVVDVYDLSDASYRYSFYIEHHNELKMRQFKVVGHIFIAMFNDVFIRYEIPLQYLP